MLSNLDAMTFMDKAFSKIPLPTQLKCQPYAAMRKYQYEDSELETFAKWLRQHVADLVQLMLTMTELLPSKILVGREVGDLSM
jgi:hypothetical protein